MKQYLIPLLISVLMMTTNAKAAIVNYYIGRDTRVTIPSGTFAGLPNPNHGRLTFLYAHTFPTNPSNNHYHGIGIYRYTGPASSPTIVPQGTNFNIPEAYTNQPPLAMSATTGGLYDGKLTLKADPSVDYSDTTINGSPMLASFAAGTPEAFLYNSSSGRYTGDMTGAAPALELISLTPGLNIGSSTQLHILQNPNDTFQVGTGGNINFAPVFWADATAPVGNYSARFRVVDLNGVLPSSGEFVFNLRVIPEPSTAALGLLSGLALLRRRR